MAIKEKDGNLVELAQAGEFDYIIHCCNCFKTMGKGMALQIKEHCPEAYQADQATIKGDRRKLGTYTKGTSPHGYTVINLYGQFRYGNNRRHLDYRFLAHGLQHFYQELKHNDELDARIGTYQLGCANAGGEWKIVKEIIEGSLPNLDVTIVNFIK